MQHYIVKNRFICQIGPGEGYHGGMKTVIDKYLNADELIDFRQKRIVTASKKYKIITFLFGLCKVIFFCATGQMALAHIHMSERGSCIRTEILVTICQLFKVKVLIHSHGGEIEPYYHSLTTAKKKRFDKAMNKAEQIIILTEGQMPFWSKIVPIDKIFILPNCVTCPSESVKDYFFDGKLNLLFLGYISEGKGVYDLIGAIKLLEEEGYFDIILRVGGNGENEKLASMIKEMRIEDKVKVFGWMDESKKQLMFEKSDVLILPSHFESFGIVLIEAMAHKLAVICGDKGYSKEIVSDGVDGLVAESGNMHDLAAKIKFFYGNYNISNFGNNGYEKVTNKYCNQVVLGQLKQLYQRLVNN